MHCVNEASNGGQNMLLSTNDLKHYLSEVHLLEMINKTPQKQNICYSKKQFELVTANIIVSDSEYYCI